MDKKVTFEEAVLAWKAGLNIFGKTSGDFVSDWNPDKQNVVAWSAIKSGDWYIKQPVNLEEVSVEDFAEFLDNNEDRVQEFLSAFTLDDLLEQLKNRLK